MNSITKTALTSRAKRQFRAALKGAAVDIPLSAGGAWLGAKAFKRRPGLGSFLGGLTTYPIVTAVELRELEKKAASVENIIAVAKKINVTPKSELSFLQKLFIKNPIFHVPKSQTKKSISKYYSESLGNSVKDRLKRFVATKMVIPALLPKPGIYSVKDPSAVVAKQMGIKGIHNHNLTNSMAKIHEGFERGGLKNHGKRMAARYLEHKDPGVLLKEHNMVTTLKGDNAERSKNFLKKLRSGYEEESINSFVNNALPGSNFQYGTSPKLSRAAIRKLLRKYYPAQLKRFGLEG